MSAFEDVIPKGAQEVTGRGRIGVNLGILVFLSALNILLLVFVEPTFEQIYAEALPGWPLPSITNFVIDGRFFLMMVAMFWPVLGFFFRRQPYAVLWINIGVVWTFIQLGASIFALFIPMAGGLITGMPDTNHH